MTYDYQPQAWREIIKSKIEELDNNPQAQEWIRRHQVVPRTEWAVFKLGGEVVSKHINDIANSLAILAHYGLYAPVVYGWGKAIDDILIAKGIPNPKHEKTKERVTTPEVLKYVQKIALEYGDRLVQALKERDVPSSRHYNVFQAVQKQWDDVPYKEHFTGEPTDLDLDPIYVSLKEGIVPIVSPMGRHGNQQLNCNADASGKVITLKMRPKHYLVVTKPGGVKKRKDGIIQEAATIREICVSRDFNNLTQSGTITDGMALKLNQAKLLLEQLRMNEHQHTVRLVGPKRIIDELFSNAGGGTYIVL